MSACSKEAPMDIAQQQTTLVKSSASAIIIDDNLFASSVSDPFKPTGLTIEDEIIMITVDYNGGCGTVDADLIGQSKVQMNNDGIPEVKAQMIFADNDKCGTNISKTFAFDISSLRSSTQNAIAINIKGIGTVLYKY